MPTLIRLVLTLAVLVGGAFVAMLALAYLVTPSQEEMTVTIPAERLSR
jgi:hypothetical protein